MFLDDRFKGVPLEAVVSAVFGRFEAKDVLEAGYKWKGEMWSTEYEISFFRAGSFNDGAGQWRYYLILRPEQLGESFDSVWLDGVINSMPSGRKYVDHRYNESILSDLSWHGGISFYEKYQNPDMPEQRYVRVGCDYGHIWDEGQQHLYNRKYVEQEARETVVALHNMFPDLLWRCTYDGSWHPADEMVCFESKEDGERQVYYWSENAHHCSPKYWREVNRPKQLAQ